MRTDVPQPARKLIPLEIRLLPSEQSIECEAVVVNSISADLASERGLVPGMGLELHRLESKTRTLWESYVGLLLQRFDEGEGHGESPEEPAPPERRESRHPTQVVHMKVKNVGPLQRILSSDVPAFVVFLLTEPQVEVGLPVEMHTDSETAHPELGIRGEIVRVVPVGPGRGFAVRFELLDDEASGGDGYEPQITLDERDLLVDEPEAAGEDASDRD